ncbi:MAG: preprotein translocase subunit YajC [Muribaculaceae bacterium]|nr:preprotein translocase subunit YajC [Muribaculaceae bacterium]
MGILLTAGEATASGGIGMFSVFYIVIFAVICYMFLFRPQKKEQKRVAAMLADMSVGDVVLTTSGFYGIVIDITDDTIIVEFGSNKNCRIPMQKSAVAQIEKPDKE